MNKNEELLIRKAQRGNIAAFEELVKEYENKVMSIILDMVNDVEDARDVYQDVFMKVFLTIKKFRFQSKFYTWLFRITVNTSINFRKKRTSQQNKATVEYQEENSLETQNIIQSNYQDPEKQLLNIELSNTIQKSINLLSPKQKAVFLLRHYHGYKLSEIAEIMNCADGTVKNYLFRSVQKMKKELKEFRSN
jgi:RNA polymerase sigma-70 factor, ECF subfamily